MRTAKKAAKKLEIARRHLVASVGLNGSTEASFVGQAFLPDFFVGRAFEPAAFVLWVLQSG
jgi:hypothetical protein